MRSFVSYTVLFMMCCFFPLLTHAYQTLRLIPSVFEAIRVAHSRDTPNRIYVQDLLREDSERLWDLLYHQNAFVFIAGSALQMPRDVLSALVDICTPYFGGDAVSAQAYVNTLEVRENRIQLETWN